jgi:hypothetical protein
LSAVALAKEEAFLAFVALAKSDQWLKFPFSKTKALLASGITQKAADENRSSQKPPAGWIGPRAHQLKVTDAEGEWRSEDCNGENTEPQPF